MATTRLRLPGLGQITEHKLSPLCRVIAMVDRPIMTMPQRSEKNTIFVSTQAIEDVPCMLLGGKRQARALLHVR